jgi:2-polyprenyl-6-hydroxyphenyl methylase/3-demethylubiquinone-9 3-methyltransferase
MSPWIVNKLRTIQGNSGKILDVGCGGGFLANELARQGYEVTGVDLAEESLKVARKHDITKSVHYEIADAYKLPYESESFDVVTAMDFLEHVDKPDEVIIEFSRVLRPGGLFFYHTFNRNFLSHVVVIKLLEWFIKNTPKNMHVIKLFIKPKELEKYCLNAGLAVINTIGIRPKIRSIDWNMVKTGIVSRNMEFMLTKGTLISYLGMARKL